MLGSGGRKIPICCSRGGGGQRHGRNFINGRRFSLLLPLRPFHRPSHSSTSATDASLPPDTQLGLLPHHDPLSMVAHYALHKYFFFLSFIDFYSGSLNPFTKYICALDFISPETHTLIRDGPAITVRYSTQQLTDPADLRRSNMVVPLRGSKASALDLAMAAAVRTIDQSNFSSIKSHQDRRKVRQKKRDV